MLNSKSSHHVTSGSDKYGGSFCKGKSVSVITRCPTSMLNGQSRSWCGDDGDDCSYGASYSGCKANDILVSLSRWAF